MEGHMNLNSTVTALRYRIENHYQILSWCRWSWVRDHTWPHVVCRYVLQDERIHTTDCPSPVLNPVEQLWDTMFRFHSCRKISNALDQIWEEIAQDTICSLISGTRGAYRPLFYILNGCTEISAQWTSLLHRSFTRFLGCLSIQPSVGRSFFLYIKTYGILYLLTH